MIDRRCALLALAGFALEACRRSTPPSPSAESAPPTGPWRELAFDASDDAEDGERALLYTPAIADAPLLIALHGRGEAGRGLDVGAHGWRDDYGVERVQDRLRAPPITRDDLQGFATDARLAQINQSLGDHPFKGLRLATPYTPDVPDRSPDGARGFARYLVDQLLPRCTSESGVASVRARTGIDGVSMGGRLALLVGLARTDVFGSVGALQPAIRVDEALMFSSMAKQAMQRAPFAFRLASSDADPFLPAVRALSAQLDADGVPHSLVVVPGPHDYIWNRGPGAAELLLFHERALRGLVAP